MKNRKIILLTLVLCLTLTFTLAGCSKGENGDNPVLYTNPLTGEKSETEIEAARPLQVSIDNVGSAIPQSNLSKADLVYEFPVEGNQSRLQAIFYSEMPDAFGPIRSTRPYFVDLTREYKAVFLAHGWSPAAKSYLLSGVVPYINAMNSDCAFYRVSDKSSPHNSYLNWSEVKRKIDENGWWNEKFELTGFQFMEEVDEEDKDKNEDSGLAGEVATYITVNYGVSRCEYTYDPETKLYTRTVGGNAYVDRETGESITVSNILVQRVTSKIVDSKGRLEINMCSGGSAVLYTNGVAIEGTWSRADLDSRTVFVDKDGNEFELQVGNTWVQVADQRCAISHK